MASLDEGFFEPDYPAGNSTNNADIEKRWQAVLEEFSEDFRPIAERFGERNVRFTPENCWLFVDTPETVDEICHDILDFGHNNRLFGCTTQGGWYGDLERPYESQYPRHILRTTGLPILFGMWKDMNCPIKRLFLFDKYCQKTTREEC